MNHPALPPQYSQLSPHSTPILPTPSPANKRTSAPVIPVEEFPENPSESFLEQMCDNDPLEGPSWLFASVHKKKRRSSAVRKLSAVWSDSERGSSVGTSGRITTSSLDSSDLDMSSPGEGASSREVSGYVLDRDLIETVVVVATPDVTLETSSAEVTPAKPATFSSSNVAVNSVTAFEEDMDMTTAVDARTNEDLNCSNQENNPVQLSGVENIDESVLSISVTHTPRTPLSSLTYTDPSGQVVKFNPRTDTGVTVAGLREAHILLNNVGMTDSTSTTPYKLSECYIDLSPGRSMSLDQLFSLGLRAGISSPVSNSPKRKKRKHASEVQAVQANQPSKKRRVTDLPGMRQKGVRASLDLIPPNMTQSTDLVVNRTIIDTSSGSNIAAGLVNVEVSESMEVGANTGLGLDVTSAPELVDVTSAPELVDVTSARKLDNVSSVPALNDVTSVPELSAPELETVESVNAATANNIDKSKKKSVMPSFVLLEKSPTKTAIDVEECVSAIDVEECVSLDESAKVTGEIPTVTNDVEGVEEGLGLVQGPEETNNVENSSEPERPRRRNRVDYAALLNDQDDQPKRVNKSAKNSIEVLESSSKRVSKEKATTKLKNVDQVISRTSADNNPRSEEGLPVLDDSKKTSGQQSKAPKKSCKTSKSLQENHLKPGKATSNPSTLSGDELETVVSHDQDQETVASEKSSSRSRKNSKRPSRVPSRGDPSDAIESSKPEETNSSEILHPEETNNTTRPSLGLDVPTTSRGSSFGPSADPSESRGRSRRGGTAVSYKELPLGKKLRQGDAGSTSVYSDFDAKSANAKVRKSGKKKQN